MFIKNAGKWIKKYIFYSRYKILISSLMPFANTAHSGRSFRDKCELKSNFLVFGSNESEGSIGSSLLQWFTSTLNIKLESSSLTDQGSEIRGGESSSSLKIDKCPPKNFILKINSAYRNPPQIKCIPGPYLQTLKKAFIDKTMLKTMKIFLKL